MNLDNFILYIKRKTSVHCLLTDIYHDAIIVTIEKQGGRYHADDIGRESIEDGYGNQRAV